MITPIVATSAAAGPAAGGDEIAAGVATSDPTVPAPRFDDLLTQAHLDRLSDGGSEGGHVHGRRGDRDRTANDREAVPADPATGQPAPSPIVQPAVMPAIPVAAPAPIHHELGADADSADMSGGWTAEREGTPAAGHVDLSGLETPSQPGESLSQLRSTGDAALTRAVLPADAAAATATGGPQADAPRSQTVTFGEHRPGRGADAQPLTVGKQWDTPPTSTGERRALDVVPTAGPGVAGREAAINQPGRAEPRPSDGIPPSTADPAATAGGRDRAAPAGRNAQASRSPEAEAAVVVQRVDAARPVYPTGAEWLAQRAVRSPQPSGVAATGTVAERPGSSETLIHEVDTGMRSPLPEPPHSVLPDAEQRPVETPALNGAQAAPPAPIASAGGVSSDHSPTTPVAGAQGQAPASRPETYRADLEGMPHPPEPPADPLFPWALSSAIDLTAASTARGQDIPERPTAGSTAGRGDLDVGTALPGSNRAPTIQPHSAGAPRATSALGAAGDADSFAAAPQPGRLEHSAPAPVRGDATRQRTPDPLPSPTESTPSAGVTASRLRAAQPEWADDQSSGVSLTPEAGRITAEGDGAAAHLQPHGAAPNPAAPAHVEHPGTARTAPQRVGFTARLAVPARPGAVAVAPRGLEDPEPVARLLGEPTGERSTARLPATAQQSANTIVAPEGAAGEPRPRVAGSASRPQSSSSLPFSVAPKTAQSVFLHPDPVPASRVRRPEPAGGVTAGLRVGAGHTGPAEATAGKAGGAAQDQLAREGDPSAAGPDSTRRVPESPTPGPDQAAAMTAAPASGLAALAGSQAQIVGRAAYAKGSAPRRDSSYTPLERPAFRPGTRTASAETRTIPIQAEQQATTRLPTMSPHIGDHQEADERPTRPLRRQDAALVTEPAPSRTAEHATTVVAGAMGGEPPAPRTSAGRGVEAPHDGGPRSPAFDRQTLAPIVQGVVVRHAALRVGAAESSFRAVLQPRTLGEVVVQVRQDATGLQVTLTPQRADTHRLLDLHLSELIAQLHAADMGTVQASVVTRDAQTSTTPAQGNGGGSASAAPQHQGMQFGSQAGTSQDGAGRQPGFAWVQDSGERGRGPMETSAASVPAPRPRLSARIAADAARIDIQA